MKCKIGVISVGVSLLPRIQALFPEEYAQGDILVEALMSSTGSVAEKRRRVESVIREMEKQGAAILIAKGGIFHTIQTRLPILHIDTMAIDILRALSHITAKGRKILLLTWEQTHFQVQDWHPVLSVQVEHEVFDDADQIPNILQPYQEHKDEYIVLAGGIGNDCAAQMGLAHQMIECSDETLAKAVEHAREVLAKEEIERYENEKLRAILSSVHDAVVAVDTSGKIILFNHAAELLLQRSREKLLGQNICTTFPELSFLSLTGKWEGRRTGDLVTIGPRTLTINLTSIVGSNGPYGSLCTLQDVTRVQKLEKKIRYELNKKGLTARYTLNDILTCSPNMKEVLHRAQVVAQGEQTVMLFGESGTGKEMLAQGIHNASNRKNMPFVAVNCAALSESLLESELFGYEEGAFTGARKGGKQGLFELAHGGTIFLDEINSISPNLQSKLLRVLEEKEIMHIGSDYVIPLDVRIIAAANENLQVMVERGLFRGDLFYRLNTVELVIPPLRQRPNDILPIFSSFLKRSGSGQIRPLTAEHERKLMTYTWPGNVRELRNTVERYLLFGTIELDPSEQITRSSNQQKGLISLKDIDRYVEEKIIRTLSVQGLTKTQIADLLGISRSALWKRMNDLDCETANSPQ